MNLLDQTVKSCMLTYPSIFPTRTAVLAHLFLVLGNGCDWNKDGILVDDTEYSTEMKYSDLDWRIEEYEEHYKEWNAKIYLKFLEETNKERKQREHIAANIDILACTPDPDFVYKYLDERGNDINHYERIDHVLQYIEDGYCLGELPTNVEESFLSGAIEILGVVNRSRRAMLELDEHGLAPYDPMRSRLHDFIEGLQTHGPTYKLREPIDFAIDPLGISSLRVELASDITPDKNILRDQKRSVWNTPVRLFCRGKEVGVYSYYNEAMTFAIPYYGLSKVDRKQLSDIHKSKNLSGI